MRIISQTKKVSVIKHEDLNFKKIGIGAYDYINNYEEILSDYKRESKFEN